LAELAGIAVAQEIYFSVFVYVVAQVEAYLTDVLCEVLRFDIRRLKIKVKDINHLKNVDVSEIIDCNSKEDLIDKIIKKELASVFYASSRLQIEYFEKVTGAQLPDATIDSWVEIKATRDIIVHNSGVSNSVYIGKTDRLARGKEGERLPMNDEYFSNSLALMKSLVGKASNTIRAGMNKKVAKQ
jgi:hypothetical protein